MQSLKLFAKSLLFILFCGQSVMAQTGVIPSGSGAYNDPYLISSWQELYWLSTNSYSWAKYYKQTADIDLSKADPAIETWNGGKGWLPLGNSNREFTGEYDGNNKVIKGLYCNRATQSGVGFFGYVGDGADISHLGLVDARVVGGSKTGVFAGWNKGEITYCSAVGAVQGAGYVGGFVGYNGNGGDNSWISNCFCRVTVVSTLSLTENAGIGGFVGYTNESHINRSYTTGTVFAAGQQVTTKGFCGLFDVTTGSVLMNHWDKEASGQTKDGANKSTFASGFTTAEMKTPSKFEYWDFEDIWKIDPQYNFGYPYLIPVKDENIELTCSYAEGNTIIAEGTVYVADSLILDYGLLVSSAAGASLELENFDRRSSLGEASETKPFVVTLPDLLFGSTYYCTAYLILSNDTIYAEPYEISTHTSLTVMPQGKGTESEPFLISSWEELYWLSQSPTAWDKHFVQTENIDFSLAVPAIETWDEGKGWLPIGNSYSNSFTGSYNGNGKIVKNLYCNRANTEYVGLFGSMRNASLVDLGIVDADISAYRYAGLVAGYAYESDIERCFTTGVVECITYGGSFLGSIMYSNLSNSFSSAVVKAPAERAEYNGGFLGYYYQASVSECYFNGRVEPSNGENAFLGTINGLADSVTNCYWNMIVSNQTSSPAIGVTGLSDEQMKNSESFADWDFASVWSIDPAYNNGYPYLTPIESDKVSLSATIVTYAAASLVLKGLLNLTDGYTVTEYGMVFGKTKSLSLRNGAFVKKESLGSTGQTTQFQALVDGLMADSTYYYSPYALCDGDTVYGDVSSVTMRSPLSELPEGEGTEASPYLISNWKELYWLSQAQEMWGAHFKQTENIYFEDASPSIETWNTYKGWKPIGNKDCYFTGSYDGNNKIVSGLYSKRSNDDVVGFCGIISEGASVFNLGVVDVDITARYSAGGLAPVNYGEIRACFTTGKIHCQSGAGGLVSVNGGWSGEGMNALIADCYSMVDVYYSSSNVDNVAAFAGTNYASVERCYSTGRVYSGINTLVQDKGFVGHVGYDALFPDNYWCTSLSLQLSTGGSDGQYATGFTQEQMTVKENFQNWDFSSVWNIDPAHNYGFPYLIKQETAKPLISFNSFVTTDSYINFKGLLLVNGDKVDKFGVVGGDARDVSLSGEHAYQADWGEADASFEFEKTADGLQAGESMYYRLFAISGVDTVYTDAIRVSTHTIPSEIPAGNGSDEKPYLISNWQELLWLSQSWQVWDKHFRQTATIDLKDAGLSSSDWNPIGPFSGVYDGGGNAILNLYCYQTTKSSLGLFEKIDKGAIVHDLGLENVYVYGNSSIGGLAGVISGEVYRCFVTGKVKGSAKIGGFVGTLSGNSATITNCFARVTVSRSSGSSLQIGGFAGYNYDGANVYKSYSAGRVYLGSSYPQLNGFVGYGSGISSSDMDDDFWDKEAAGLNSAKSISDAYATAALSLQMKEKQTFIDAGWDFVAEAQNGSDDIWAIHPSQNNGYPFLTFMQAGSARLYVSTHAVSGADLELTGLVVVGNSPIVEYGIIGGTDSVSSLNSENILFKKVFDKVSETTYFTALQSGLQEDTKYLYRSYFIIGNDTLLGEYQTFTTHPIASQIPNGEGTAAAPYLISNWQELYWLSQSPEFWSAHFLQTANIDLREAVPAIETWDKGAGWSCIGNSSKLFSGAYNGRGHVISGLYCNRPDTYHIGMFSYIGADGSVADLGLVDLCVYGSLYTGGLVGRNYGSLSRSFVTGAVSGSGYVGGFAGYNSNGFIEDCFAKVTVSRSYGTSSTLGGFLGYMAGDTLNRCYSTGAVSYNYTDNPENKGFAGSVQTADSRSMTNNYWDVETSAQNSTGSILTSNEVQGLTSAEMKVASNFTSWDFSAVWSIDPLVNNGYPYLQTADNTYDYLQKPEIEMLSAVSDVVSVTLEAEISALGNGSISSYGFLIGDQLQLSLAGGNYLNKAELGSRGNIGGFNAVFEDLDANTQYFYRAYAVNAYGVTYSPAVEIFTIPLPPVKPAGSGDSEDDPYLIENLQHLSWISEQTNNNGQSFEGKFFLQVNDIDAKGTKTWNGGIGWMPISAKSLAFEGNYNGNGHLISNLSVNRSNIKIIQSLDTIPVGLWSRLGENSVIRNVIVEDCSLTNMESAGGLAAENRGVVQNCSVSGKVVSSKCTGGLVAVNYGDISRCKTDCAVTYSDLHYSQDSTSIGGFIGINEGVISESKSTSVINTSYREGAGFVESNNGTIEKCAAIGVLEEMQEGATSGFVNKNTGTVSDSYCFVDNGAAGLCMNNSGILSNCYFAGTVQWRTVAPSAGDLSGLFWDADVSGVFDAIAGATALTTVEMKRAHNFIGEGWDFVGETANGSEDIWVIHPSYNNGYPFLAWEAPQLTYLGGKVYYDRDKNGAESEGDVPIGGLTVELQPLGTVTGTAPDGTFMFYAEPGEYTVKIKPSAPYTQGTDQLEFPVKIELLKDSVLPSIGVYGVDFVDFDLSMATVWTRCGNTVPLWVVAQNTGNIASDVSLSVKLDSLVEFNSSDTEIAATDDDGTLHFDLAGLNPYESRKVKLFVSAPRARMDTIVYISTIAKEGSTMAEDSIRNIVRCSYDPNDVQVFPMGIQPEGNVPMGQELSYMIRFQNTGNDTAFMVDVLDTLAATIDPASFKFVGASHPVRYFVNPDGSMRFLFEDINLLDSTSNEPESHGFILFKVKPKADVVSGDQALLKASIYFDYNPPVVTNTVVSTFTQPDDVVTQVFKIKDGWNLISLYVEPEDARLEEALSSCLSSIEEIKTLDKFYKSTYDPVYSSLKLIKGGLAYLIKAKGEGECSVSGKPVFTPFEYSLGKGWNLIGCPVNGTPGFSDILHNTSTEKLINFDATWLPEATDNPVIKFEPGKGYFIYTGADGSVQWGE